MGMSVKRRAVRFRGKDTCRGSGKSQDGQSHEEEVGSLSPLALNAPWALDFWFLSTLASGTHLTPPPAFSLSLYIFYAPVSAPPSAPGA